MSDDDMFFSDGFGGFTRVTAKEIKDATDEEFENLRRSSRPMTPFTPDPTDTSAGEDPPEFSDLWRAICDAQDHPEDASKQEHMKRVHAAYWTGKRYAEYLRPYVSSAPRLPKPLFRHPIRRGT